MEDVSEAFTGLRNHTSRAVVPELETSDSNVSAKFTSFIHAYMYWTSGHTRVMGIWVG